MRPVKPTAGVVLYVGLHCFTTTFVGIGGSFLAIGFTFFTGVTLKSGVLHPINAVLLVGVTAAVWALIGFLVYGSATVTRDVLKDTSLPEPN